MPSSFSQVLDSATVADGTLRARVPDDWTQGRTVFGGLQAALALRAMRNVVAPEAPLRTLQGTFAAPLPAGETHATAEVLRTGRSATQAEARLGTAAGTAAVFLAVFGDDRPSVVRRAPVQPRVDAGDETEFRFIPGVMPSFTQFFPARWVSGGTPFSGHPMPSAVIEVSMRDDATVAGDEHVLAIADFPPPVALSMLDQPAQGSTTAWMIEFLGGLGELGLEGWRLDTEMVAASNGYTSQSVMVWGPGGVPVALSRQSMVVFG
jgi:acyl-CoA thioesterase superfamily protein/acyl-Coa thioesterase superfamily protein